MGEARQSFDTLKAILVEAEQISSADALAPHRDRIARLRWALLREGPTAELEHEIVSLRSRIARDSETPTAQQERKP